jgi:hypothetical protein
VADFRVSGFSSEVEELLRERAEAQGIGVGELIRRLVEQCLAVSESAVRLDHFDRLEESGLDGDTAAFLAEIGVFESVGEKELS